MGEKNACFFFWYMTSWTSVECQCKILSHEMCRCSLTQRKRHRNLTFTVDVWGSWKFPSFSWSFGGKCGMWCLAVVTYSQEYDKRQPNVTLLITAIENIRVFLLHEPEGGLTLARAEGEHGWLAFACWTSSHHQHLIETGGLQLWQPQGLLTARDTNRLPAPNHCSHFIDLTHTQKTTHTHIHKYKHMTQNDREKQYHLMAHNPPHLSLFPSLDDDRERPRKQCLRDFCHSFQLQQNGVLLPAKS